MHVHMGMPGLTMAERRAAPARRAEEPVNFMVVGWRRGWVLCVV